MTVREIFADAQREIRDTDLLPDRAAELDAQLSALLGNISAEIRLAEVDFNQVLLSCLRSEKAANRAKVLAETTPQWVRRQEARDMEKVTLEMIRALRHIGRANHEAMRLQR